MKVALVYDRVNKWGGAERVLLALHEIWPQAPLYTAVYDPAGAPWAKVFEVRSSFLQHLPLAKNHHELFPWLTPLAFETFNFDEFEVVISVTSAEAKGVITKPQTLHICYCLTPTRYLWSGYEQYLSAPGMGLLDTLAKRTLVRLAPTLRRWDKIASSRPDYYIAISRRVKERIKRYYGRDLQAIIYPPVNLDKFKIQNSKFKIQKENQYFLIVSRLVGYKRVDLVVEAFNWLGWPLVVVGDGWERKALAARARKNIHFVGQNLTDSELVAYYGNCRALVLAGEEDFGIVALEAQACGKPVIAYKESGIAEIVVDGKTGILFGEQSATALIEALKQFETMRFDFSISRKNAQRFDQSRFCQKMKQTVLSLYRNYHTL